MSTKFHFSERALADRFAEDILAYFSLVNTQLYIGRLFVGLDTDLV